VSQAKRGKKGTELTPAEQLAEVFILEDSLKLHGKGRFALLGENGNAYSIMARVGKALRKTGWSDRAVDAVHVLMKAGDYDHLLQTAMRFQHPAAFRAEMLRMEADALLAQADVAMREG
jgi:hypothetical protein